MKSAIPFLIFILTIGFVSCKDDDTRFETRIVANAVLMSKQDVRASIAVESQQSIAESGKIFTYLDYVFVNDQNRGVHIIDNRVPQNPQKIGFIKIPGNFDIEVRNDILYADSYTDLVLFDISDIDAISYLDTYEDVFNGFGFAQAAIDQGADRIEYGEYDPNESFIIDWIYEEIVVEIQNVGDAILLEDSASITNGNTTGQGGSFARFKIVDTYLYAVDYSDLYVFDIAVLGTAIAQEQQNIGWQIETIFNQGDYLYIGSQTGMYIYSIEDRTSPVFSSLIEHLRFCDPVVVDGDYAYLTLRGGNVCGQNLSVLEVIDISDKTAPFIIEDYPMEEPYGLGFKDTLLFVSDGPNGLKIYDKSDPIHLILLQTIEDVNVFDVIPQSDKLIAIADNRLFQYDYQPNGLSLISTYNME